jgi:hypothetical protein
MGTLSTFCAVALQNKIFKDFAYPYEKLTDSKDCTKNLIKNFFFGFPSLSLVDFLQCNTHH